MMTPHEHLAVRLRFDAEDALAHFAAAQRSLDAMAAELIEDYRRLAESGVAMNEAVQRYAERRNLKSGLDLLERIAKTLPQRRRSKGVRRHIRRTKAQQRRA